MRASERAERSTLNVQRLTLNVTEWTGSRSHERQRVVRLCSGRLLGGCERQRVGSLPFHALAFAAPQGMREPQVSPRTSAFSVERSALSVGARSPRAWIQAPTAAIPSLALAPAESPPSS